MAQVFISYKSTEREEVSRIAQGLQAEGFSVWWDHALITGQDYSDVIDAEISAAKVIMPVWSKDSIKSRWVKAEAERAWDKLFPVRIDDVPPPLPYNKLHTMDLVGWRGDRADPRWVRLVADLRAIVSGASSTALQTLEPLKPRTRGRTLILAAALGAVGLAGGGAWAWMRLSAPPSETAALTSPAPPAAAPASEPLVPPVAVEQPQGRAESLPETRALRERGIATYADAVSVLRETGGQVRLEICAAGRAAPCGATNVRVGEVITLRVTSQVSGRLILLDENALGERTQIFPNGLTRGGAAIMLTAGRSVELPAADHGFVFGVSEPAGRSRLIAMVLPEQAPLPTIVAENTRERGIAAIPSDRADDFAAAVTAAMPASGGAAVAIGELSYVVTR